MARKAEKDYTGSMQVGATLSQEQLAEIQQATMLKRAVQAAHAQQLSLIESVRLQAMSRPPMVPPVGQIFDEKA